MAAIKNLKELILQFSDEQKCRDFLIQQRWNGCPICPYCKSDKWYTIENGKRFKCGNKNCHKKYSVTVGTLFHNSNIPLTTWLPAVYLLQSHKKGISSTQLAKDLGITQKTAWFMLHRIRESLKETHADNLKNTVEIDELYSGGRGKNLSHKKRKELRKDDSGNFINKEMVLGMVEREGKLRLFHLGGANSKHKIQAEIYKNVDRDATIMTDSENAYQFVKNQYSSHEVVHHTQKEYVRDGYIHTNTIEGAFGLFRRCVIGTYHKLSPKHLSRYCVEIAHRYNTRNLKDGERFENSLKNIETPLSWKELVKSNGLTAQTIIEPKIPEIKLGIRGKKNPVCQIHCGEVIATFPSVKEAGEITGISKTSISKVLGGHRNNAGGYQWKYL